MYEQFIAQVIIKRLEDLIVAAFAQLDGQDSDDFSELYLTLEGNKQDITRLSGLSAEVIDKLTALIGEKAAAMLGSELLNNKTPDHKNTEERSKSPKVPIKRQTAQDILRAQLLTIITNKVEQGENDNSTATLAELKMAKIISINLLKQILNNKNITMKTMVELAKIQSYIKAAMTNLVQLISNNGQAPNQAVKISRQTNVLEKLSSELNIMSSRHKGIGSELINAPDFTPHVDKDISRGR